MTGCRFDLSARPASCWQRNLRRAVPTRCRHWSLDIPGVVAWAGAAALLHRRAPKLPLIPAQPSGLGTQTADAKALKARSIFSAIGASERSFWVGCETNIRLLTISEIGPRRWRSGLLMGGYYLGRCPRLIWVGLLARVTPRGGMDHAFALAKNVQTPLPTRRRQHLGKHPAR